MSDSVDSRRYSQQEFARVLRTAAELQDRLRIPVRADGYSLAEMEQIAADVGIPAAFVREAVTSLAAPQPGLGARILGGSYAVHIAQHVPVHVDDAVLPALVDEIRRAFGKQGEVSHVLGSLEWHSKEELGSVHVNIARRGDTTRIELFADREISAGLLLTLVPMMSALAGAVIAGASGLEGLEIVGAVAGTVTIGVAGMRAAWRAATKSWQDRFTRLLGQLVNRAAEGAEQPR